MFDENLFELGNSCKRKHFYENTEKSLRYKKGKVCLECYKVRKARRYQSTKEERNKKRRQNYRENIIECREKANEYKRLNKDKILATSRRRYKENPEVQKKLKHSAKTYRENNTEKVNQAQRRYYEKNREKLLQQRKNLYAKNHEKMLRRSQIKTLLRRAKKKAVHQYPYTAIDIEAKIDHFNRCCAYCGISFVGTNANVDHFLPIALGGTDTLNNLIPACKSCNSSKQARDPVRWYKTRKHYSDLKLTKILKHLGKTRSNYNQLSLL